VPSYDIHCPVHGEREVFARLADCVTDAAGRFRVPCDECEAYCTPIVAAVPTHGIVFMQDAPELGTTFYSQREKAAHLAKAGLVETDRNTSFYRQSIERMKDTGADRKAGRNVKKPVGRLKSCTPIPVEAA